MTMTAANNSSTTNHNSTCTLRLFGIMVANGRVQQSNRSVLILFLLYFYPHKPTDGIIQSLLLCSG